MSLGILSLMAALHARQPLLVYPVSTKSNIECTYSTKTTGYNVPVGWYCWQRSK